MFINIIKYQLTQKHIKLIDEHMQAVFKQYMGRPWPVSAKGKRRTSTDKNLQRCTGDCTCTSYAQCEQNAASYTSAAKYNNAYHDAVDKTFNSSKALKRPTNQCLKKHFCASSEVKHRVRIYNQYKIFLYSIIIILWL